MPLGPRPYVVPRAAGSPALCARGQQQNGQLLAHEPRTTGVRHAVTLRASARVFMGASPRWPRTVCFLSSQSPKSLCFPASMLCEAASPARVTAVAVADGKWLCLSGKSVGDDVIGIYLSGAVPVFSVHTCSRRKAGVLMDAEGTDSQPGTRASGRDVCRECSYAARREHSSRTLASPCCFLCLTRRSPPLQVHVPVPQHGHQDPIHVAVPPGRGPSVAPAAPVPADLPAEDPHSRAGPPEPGQPCPLPDRHHQVSGLSPPSKGAGRSRQNGGPCAPGESEKGKHAAAAFYAVLDTFLENCM